MSLWRTLLPFKFSWNAEANCGLEHVSNRFMHYMYSLRTMAKSGNTSDFPIILLGGSEVILLRAVLQGWFRDLPREMSAITRNESRSYFENQSSR